MKSHTNIPKKNTSYSLYNLIYSPLPYINLDITNSTVSSSNYTTANVQNDYNLVDPNNEFDIFIYDPNNPKINIFIN